MTNHFTISVNNFYKAIIIAFFFSVTFSNNLDNLTKCLWVKSDELLNNSIESIITNAYRSEYKIIYFQLDIHENSHYNPNLDPSNQKYEKDPLKEVLYWANIYDIDIHIWINAYKIWSSNTRPPPNHIYYKLKEKHKDWFASDINGFNDYKITFNPNNTNNMSNIFISPLNEDCNNYIISIILKLVSDYSINGNPKFKGIHLDYLRYKDSMYGYNFIGRNIFYNLSKIDPVYLNRNRYLKKDSLLNIIKDDWIDFKSSKISSLLSEVKLILQNKKNIKLSVAVKPILKEAKVRWIQNWDQWIKNDLVDYVVVMNYFNDTESFSSNLWNIYKVFNDQKYIDKIYIGVNVIYSDLGTNEIKDINIIKEQVRNVKDFSFPGLSIFSFEYFKYKPTLYLDIFY